MSDDVKSIESSEQDSSPRELIEIAHGTVAYYLTTGTRAISYSGHVYAATAAARGDLGPAGAGQTNKELAVTLPIDHAFTKRYLQMLSPPKSITITLRRYYSPTVVETAWVGIVAGVSVNDDGTEATFRCPSKAASALLRVIPGVTAQRTCPHTLYGTMCGIARTDTDPDGLAHQITTTVIGVNGRDVRVDLLDTGRNGSWAELGEIEHVSSGEIMTVIKQTDLNPGVSSVAVLTMQTVLPPLKIGDSVKISAGCNRSIETCHRRFQNRQRFGGFNRLPKSNAHLPWNVFSSSEGEL